MSTNPPKSVVYVDASGNVVGCCFDSGTTPDLATFQATKPEATAKHTGCPWLLRPKDSFGTDGLYPAGGYHQLTGADPTNPDHYSLVIVPRGFVIEDLVAPQDQGRDVRTINYRTALLGSLHKHEKTTDHGQLLCVEYYLTSAMTTLVLSVCIFKDEACTQPGYNRAPGTAMALDRWTKRDWYRKDGTVGATKKNPKVYDTLKKKQKESKRRRVNVIDELWPAVFEMLLVTSAADPTTPTLPEIAQAATDANVVQATYSQRVNDYIRSGDLAWTVAPESPNITDDATAWLDNLTDTNADPVIAAISAAAGWEGSIRANILAAVQPVA